MMDIFKIMEFLPHRYPFLLVDKVLEIKGDEIVAIKNVTINEPFFQGHFPGDPIMPGVLIVESMAQTGGLLMMSKIEDKENKIGYFAGIDKVKFRKPVRPGDTLRNVVKIVRQRGNLFVMEAKSYVGDTLVAEGTLTAAVVDRAKT